MNKEDKIFRVTNRSASRVFYAVPELGIKSRKYEPGETKRVSYAELEGLSFIPGGMELMRDYLLIQDIFHLLFLDQNLQNLLLIFSYLNNH